MRFAKVNRIRLDLLASANGASLTVELPSEMNRHLAKFYINRRDLYSTIPADE